jgi:sortase A
VLRRWRALIAATLLAVLLLRAAQEPVSAGSAGAPPGVSPVNPVELRVPAAGIDAAVQDVGTTPDGSMDVPSNFTDVAWFAPGYEPGQLGNAVFDGHVSNVDSAAVFYYVKDLTPGDTIYVTGDDGSTLQFSVTDVESYPLDQTPLEQIFGPSDWPQVVLITCGGDWHPDVHLFDHRIVVYASLVDSG